MQTIQVKNGQSLFDIAVQYCGSVSAVSSIVKFNNLSFTEDLVEGQKLFVPDITNIKVVNDFLNEAFSPANDINLEPWNENILTEFVLYNLNAKAIKTDVQYSSSALSLSRANIYVGNSGGTFNVDVVCSGEWQILTDGVGVSVTPNTGTGNGSFVITVAENPTFNDRNLVVQVFAGGISRVINIYQRESNTLVIGWTNSFNLPNLQNEGAVDFLIDVACNGEFQVVSTVEWVLITKFSDSFNVRILPNYSGVNRTGFVNISTVGIQLVRTVNQSL